MNKVRPKPLKIHIHFSKNGSEFENSFDIPSLKDEVLDVLMVFHQNGGSGSLQNQKIRGSGAKQILKNLNLVKTQKIFATYSSI